MISNATFTTALLLVGVGFGLPLLGQVVKALTSIERKLDDIDTELKRRR